MHINVSHSPTVRQEVIQETHPEALGSDNKINSAARKISETEGRLVYRVSSKTTKATQRIPVCLRGKQNNKNQKQKGREKPCFKNKMNWLEWRCTPLIPATRFRGRRIPVSLRFSPLSLLSPYTGPCLAILFSLLSNFFRLSFASA